MSNAPTCNVNPNAPVVQPKAVPLPSIPIATDLPSALMALSAIRTILNVSNNANSPQNNVTPYTVKNPQPTSKQQQPGPSSGSKTSGFTQTNVVTQDIKVYNPDNKSQYVTVTQITGLTMVNNVTGETWTWTQQGSSVPGGGQ